MSPRPDEHQARGSEAPRREPPPGLFERVASYMSLLLLAAVACFLVREGLGPERAPAFEVRAGDVREVSGQYHLPLDVRNTGGVSVQNLKVRVELVDGQQTVASAEVGVAWLPAHSKRRAAVIFDVDPAPFRVDAHPVGYELP